MSHSITFHCVYFELSTVPKRDTIEVKYMHKVLSSRFPVFNLIPEQKIAKNRNKLQKIAKNRKKSIKLIAISPQMKKSI